MCRALASKFLLLLVYLAVKVISVQENETVLELVHVFFRHGSRTPENSDLYPLDPLNKDGFYPFGLGQLTNIGKRRAYALGKYLAKRYSSLLGEIYEPDLLFMQSTDYVRTQMSALLVLAGLFPPPDELLWNEELNWMPVPYTYKPRLHDYELARAFIYCPKLKEEIDKIIESEYAQSILHENKETFDYISAHSGKKITTFLDAFYMYQGLNAEDKMNLTLPSWTKSVFPPFLHDMAVKFLNFESSTRLTRRLNGGRMLKKVIDNMVTKSKGLLKPEKRRMFLYSGHESNVVSIMASLNVFDLKFPDYSSAIILELYKNIVSNQYTVKIIYIRDVYKEAEELVVPGCSKFCPLNELIELVKDHLPNNYTEECESSVLLD